MTAKMTKDGERLIANLSISIIEDYIDHARYLNREAIEQMPVSKPLPGTEFLHHAMREGIIGYDLYQQLKRLAEDPTLEYNIVIQ